MPRHTGLEEAELPATERLLGLSDGVVAIALTLLTLNLAVPAITSRNSPSDLWRALAHMQPQFASYLISFYVIASYWLTHHRVFRLVRGHDEGMAWWNFVFLLTITTMPFSASLLGRFGQNPLAVDLFAANLLAASIATQVTLAYGRRKHLLAPTATRSVLAYNRVRGLGISLVIAASIGIAWVDPDGAKYVWILLPVVHEVANRVSRRSEAGTESTRPTGATAVSESGPTAVREAVPEAESADAAAKLRRLEG